jgi:hypothetical protein
LSHMLGHAGTRVWIVPVSLLRLFTWLYTLWIFLLFTHGFLILPYRMVTLWTICLYLALGPLWNLSGTSSPLWDASPLLSTFLTFLPHGSRVLGSCLIMLLTGGLWTAFGGLGPQSQDSRSLHLSRQDGLFVISCPRSARVNRLRASRN